MAKNTTFAQLKLAAQAAKKYIDEVIGDIQTQLGGKASSSHTHTPSQVGLGNVPNVTTNNQAPTFSQASSRTNIASGDTLTTIFGKIMKWFADLKTVAFSGDYNDLSNKPTSMTPTSHSHTISNVTGLQDALNGKAASSHTSESIASSTGAHSLRYYNGKLQYNDKGTWKTLSISDLLI